MLMARPNGPLGVEGRKQERDQYTPAEEKQTDISIGRAIISKECKTIRRKPRRAAALHQIRSARQSQNQN
jgi:hypothetical protein